MPVAESSPSNLKLFMLLLGCKPPGRHTEQHRGPRVASPGAFLPRLPGMTHYFNGISTWREIWFDRSVGLYGWMDTMFPAWVDSLAMIAAGGVLLLLVRGMVDLNVEIVRASERADANQPQRRRAFLSRRGSAQRARVLQLGRFADLAELHQRSHGQPPGTRPHLWLS